MKRKVTVIAVGIIMIALSCTYLGGIRRVYYDVLAEFGFLPQLSFHEQDSWDTFDKFPIESGDTVFFGDSLTEHGPWSKLFPQIRVRNLGIGGQTIDHLTLGLRRSAPATGRKLFLMIGINDLVRGADLTDLKKRYLALFEELRSEWPSDRIYLQSLLPTSHPKLADKKNLILEGNLYLKQAAQQFGFHYIDLYPLFVDSNGGLKLDYSSGDGLHLNHKAYETWRLGLAPHLP